jgi:hypothetical protein
MDNSGPELTDFNFKFALSHGDIDHIIRRIGYADSSANVVASASGHWAALDPHFLFSTSCGRVEHLLIDILLVHLHGLASEAILLLHH